jgi:hypothetical protein
VPHINPEVRAIFFCQDYTILMISLQLLPTKSKKKEGDE